MRGDPHFPTFSSLSLDGARSGAEEREKDMEQAWAHPKNTGS
jgi:hypothetical protein